MSLKTVSAGQCLPDEINVIIEISMNADPIKYEIDKETGEVFVDRLLGTAMHYPCNYGYVNNTLCGDGDPIDVLVIMPLPLLVGSVICCRPVGVLKMSDEGGEDAKVIAVPVDSVTPLYQSVKTVTDIPEQTLKQIAHFFEHYKDLEAGKWVKLSGWEGVEAAKQEIQESVENFNNTL